MLKGLLFFIGRIAERQATAPCQTSSVFVVLHAKNISLHRDVDPEEAERVTRDENMTCHCIN